MILLTCVKRSDYHLCDVDEYNFILCAANWRLEKYNKLCYPVMGYKNDDVIACNEEKYESVEQI